MLTEYPIPCIIDPTKSCDCPSKDFATRMFLTVVKALIEEDKMSEPDAIQAYKNADLITKVLHLPDKVVNNCPNSPFKKYGAEKITT